MECLECFRPVVAHVKQHLVPELRGFSCDTGILLPRTQRSAAATNNLDLAQSVCLRFVELQYAASFHLQLGAPLPLPYRDMVEMLVSRPVAKGAACPMARIVSELLFAKWIFEGDCRECGRSIAHVDAASNRSPQPTLF